MRGFFMALIVVAVIVVPGADPASAADGVDLETSLSNNIDLPVPDSPDLLNVEVNNQGTATATNVEVDVPVPVGASVLDVSDNCATVGATIACRFASLAPGEGQGANLYLSFDTTGTYTVTSSASADQPDSNGSSTDQIGVNIGPENADLEGHSESTRVALGTQPTFNVFHRFDNLGPTASGDATVSGTVTGGGAIVPGSFKFVRSFFGSGNVADDECTVTATTFTCAPVFSGGVFYAPEPFVFYDVTLPTTPSTVVASATLTGRADPNHANDTSTITVDVAEPAAEIWTQMPTFSSPIASQEPFLVYGTVSNAGELDAQDVVAVLQAPADWDLAVPTGPLPPGVSCDILTSPHAMRCTSASLPAGSTWSVEAMVTPPAGVGSGSFSLSVSTTTPEIGTYPDDASTTIQFAPGRTLTIDPSTDLDDGAVVTFSGSGFTPNAPIFYCEGVVTGMAPTPSDCGTPYQSTVSDANGAFSVSVTIERFLVVNDVGVVDCAQPDSRCGIGAADVTAPGGPAVIQPMSFTPRPPVDDPFDARIAGTVTGANSAPASGVIVLAYRASETWIAALRTTTDASGNYVLENAEPGIAYRIRLQAPTNSNLVTEWYGGPGSSGAPSRASAVDVRLSATQPVVDVDTELATGSSVTGRVLGPVGAPVANATVWAYRNEDQLVGGYAARTASDGSYRIDGIQPDTALRIRFAPAPGSGLAAEWFDDSATRQSATPVQVPLGQSVDASAQLAAAP